MYWTNKIISCSLGGFAGTRFTFSFELFKFRSYIFFNYFACNFPASALIFINSRRFRQFKTIYADKMTLINLNKYQIRQGFWYTHSLIFPRLLAVSRGIFRKYLQVYIIILLFLHDTSAINLTRLKRSGG